MKDLINIDCQEFVNYSREHSDNLLIEFAEFYPFGAQVDLDGNLTGVGYQSETERPKSAEVIKSLTTYFENELIENTIRSYSITYDSILTNSDYPKGIDCITILTKHKMEDASIEYFFPYLINESGAIEYHTGWAIRN